MRPVIHNRNGIPFYYQKTPMEFKQDIYERYHEMVVRNAAVHTADHWWGKYPFQAIFDFAENHYPKSIDSNILEIGCGTGRWIASLATQYPKSTCWGIDYSYQMLKWANDYWVKGKETTIDFADRGVPKLSQKQEPLNNLKFGLAKAEKLPFEEKSQNLVVNSFLFDRLENPIKALEEMYRVLKPTGTLIVITPLNFKKARHWKIFYPPNKISTIVKDTGFTILDWKEDLIINEPLDGHGNLIRWKCLCFAVKKG